MGDNEKCISERAEEGGFDSCSNGCGWGVAVFAASGFCGHGWSSWRPVSL